MALPRLISIDFDDTFTADPELWSFFIAKAEVLGHKVVCVSARLDTHANRQEMTGALPSGVELHLCGSKPKRHHTSSNGIEIHIWIDDSPEAIVGEHERLHAAYEEIERMRLLVHEAREMRDKALQEAQIAVQKEMAALRAEITRLRSVALNTTLLQALDDPTKSGQAAQALSDYTLIQMKRE